MLECDEIPPLGVITMQIIATAYVPVRVHNHGRNFNDRPESTTVQWAFFSSLLADSFYLLDSSLFGMGCLDPDGRVKILMTPDHDATQPAQDTLHLRHCTSVPEATSLPQDGSLLSRVSSLASGSGRKTFAEGCAKDLVECCSETATISTDKARTEAHTG